MGINLLPPKYQPQPVIKKNRLKNMLLCTIVIICLLLGGTGYYFYRTNLEKDLASLRVKITDLGQIQKTVEQNQETLKTLQTLAELQEKTVGHLRLWSSLLGEIAKKMEGHLWLVEIKSEQEKITIRGEASDLVVVGNFRQEINGLPWVENVEIKLTEKISNRQSLLANSQDLDLFQSFAEREEIVLGEKVKFLLTVQIKEKWQLPFFEGGEPE